MLRRSRSLFAISGPMCGLALAVVTYAGGPPSWVDDLSPIARGDWNDDRAAHLLERSGFGGTPEEIERLAAMTPSQAVEWLVDYEAIDNSALEPFDESRIWDPGMDPFPPSRAEAVRIGRERGEALGVKVLPEGSPRRLQPVVDKFFYGLRANSIETQRLGAWWANRRHQGARLPDDAAAERDAARERSGHPSRSAPRDPEGSRDARVSRQRRERQETPE
jgi:hypothetical protein